MSAEVHLIDEIVRHRISETAFYRWIVRNFTRADSLDLALSDHLNTSTYMSTDDIREFFFK